MFVGNPMRCKLGAESDGARGFRANADVIASAVSKGHRRWLRSVVSAVVVIALHAGVFYSLTRDVQAVAPTVSVPLIVSLLTALEPVPDKPRAAQDPKPSPNPPHRKAPAVAKAPPSQPAPPVAPEPVPVVEELSPPQALAPPPAPAPERPALPKVIPPRFDAAYLNNPVPAYPLLSRRLGEQGRVMLRVHVGSDGAAREVQVRESSGSPRLDHAAKEAVERWKFLPAREGDRPVGAWLVVPVRFSLSSRG